MKFRNWKISITSRLWNNKHNRQRVWRIGTLNSKVSHWINEVSFKSNNWVEKVLLISTRLLQEMSFNKHKMEAHLQWIWFSLLVKFNGSPHTRTIIRFNCLNFEHKTSYFNVFHSLRNTNLVISRFSPQLELVKLGTKNALMLHTLQFSDHERFGKLNELSITHMAKWRRNNLLKQWENLFSSLLRWQIMNRLGPVRPSKVVCTNKSETETTKNPNWFASFL